MNPLSSVIEEEKKAVLPIESEPPKIQKLFDVVNTTSLTQEEWADFQSRIAPEVEADTNIVIKAGIGDTLHEMGNTWKNLKVFGGQTQIAIGGFGSEEMVSRGRALIKSAMSEIEASDKEYLENKSIPLSGKDYESWTYGISSGATNYAPLLSAALLKAPMAGIALMYGQSLGSESVEKANIYKETSGDKDFSKYGSTQAWKDTLFSSAYATGEAILEKRFGVPQQAKLVKAPILENSKRVGLTALSEGGTETLQSLLDIGLDLSGGYIDVSKLPERFVGAVKEGVIGSILGGSVGVGGALAHRSQAKSILREELRNTVPEKDLDKVVDTIYSGVEANMSNVLTAELVQSEELRNKHGQVYDSMLRAINGAVDSSGAFEGISEAEKAQYVSDTGKLFADQVLAEANKRGVLIDEVIKAKDIRYEDGKIRLANEGTVVAENKGVLFHEGKGYVGYSKSVNAVEAEAENRMPATYASKKLGVKTEAIKEFLDTSEWHHYGKMFNKVNVYDINPYLLIKEGNEAKLKEEGYSKEEIQEFKETFEKMKSYKKPKDVEKKYKANIEWIEWVNKKPKKHSLENVDVIEKGQFYTFKTKDGDVRKKIGSNGTYVVSEEQIKRKEYEETLDKKIKEINDDVLKKLKEGKYKEYLKENNLDKPSFKEFEEFNTDTNVSNDNFYIKKQKPTSKQKEDGLRRIHKENDVFQLQEWDGNNWNVLEERKEFNPKIWDGKEAKNVYDFVENDLINPYTLEEKEEAVYNYENKNDDNIYKQGEKGSFNVSEKAISITKNADFSTLPHEMAHYWLDNMWEYTRSGNASEAYKTQFGAIENWLGIKPTQTRITRGQQEKFARGYEKYLLNGDLPTPMIKGSFDDYDKWLKKVYNDAAQLRVKLSEDAVRFFQSMTSGELPAYDSLVPAKSKEVKDQIEKEARAATKDIEQITKPTPVARVESTITSTDKGKSAVYERETERNANILGSELPELEYSKINLNEQAEKAADWVRDNLYQAKRVVDGEIEPPKGLLDTSIRIAYEQEMLNAGNIDEYLRALKLHSSAQTIRGQEISAERISDDDITTPKFWFDTLSYNRRSVVAKNVLKTQIGRNIFKEDAPVKRLNDLIKQHTKELTEMLKGVDEVKKQEVMQDYTEKLRKQYGLPDSDVLYQSDSKPAVMSFIEEVFGVSVSNEEMAEIVAKTRNIQMSIEKTEDKSGNPSIETLKLYDDLNKLIESKTPSNPIAIMTSIVGRSVMLASVKSPVLNIISNAETLLTEGITNRILTAVQSKQAGTIVDNDVVKDYLTYGVKAYINSGYNVSTTEDGDFKQVVRGEKILTTQGSGRFRKIAQKLEKGVFKYAMGFPDSLSKDIAFSDYVNLEATKIAKAEGKGSERATEIFKDVILLDPKTKLGEEIRHRAIAYAHKATFTDDTTSSRVAMSIRNVFNIAGGDVRLGDQIMPFVKTPANVIALGLEYGYGALYAIPNLPTIIKDVKSGNITEKTRKSIQYATRNGLGVVLATLLAYAIDPEDYIPEYESLTPSERNLIKEKNGVFNSIRIGDKYISLDYFGPLGAVLAGVLSARKENTAEEAAVAYLKSSLEQIKRIPGVKEVSEAYSDISEYTKQSGEKTLADLRNAISNFVISRTVPAIVSDVAKMVDDVQRDTNKSILNVAKSKIPLLRETLPEKVSTLTGKPLEEESALSVLFFGARVKTAEENAAIEEIDRLYKEGIKPSLSDVTRYGDIKTIPDEYKPEVREEFASEYAKKVGKLITKNRYKNKDDEQKKKMLNEIRSDVLDDLKKKYKGLIKK